MFESQNLPFAIKKPVKEERGGGRGGSKTKKISDRKILPYQMNQRSRRIEDRTKSREKGRKKGMSSLIRVSKSSDMLPCS